jgi:L-fuconolactonase
VIPQFPVVDAHHHLWDPAKHRYPWMDRGTEKINIPFGVADLEAVASTTPIAESIVVQATSSTEETRELLELSATAGPIVGVVGWVDLEREDVADQLAKAKELPGTLVGIRHQVNAEPDPDWLLRPAVLRGLRAVQAAGLTYDLLVTADHRDACLRVVSELDELTFVLDHAGNPAGDPTADPTGDPTGDPRWAEWLTTLSGFGNVACKVSGLLAGADQDARDRAIAVSRFAIDRFGPERAMFGSDWPVSFLFADYSTVWSTAVEATIGLSDAERSEFFSGAARRAYGIGKEEK